MLWGSTINPSKARTYELPMLDTLLPPLQTNVEPPVFTVTSTKTHPKPTAHLPGDHGTAEGENDKPAFPGQGGSKTNSTAPSSSMSPTPDEGWFPGMSKLIRSKEWFFGAIGAVALFGIATGVFFWRRRALRRRRDAYTSLAGDDVAMGSIAPDGRRHKGGAPTKELYDAFGEVSDDEDADEETGLRTGRTSPGGLGFHSGFLDDDDPQSARTPRYKDEPDDESKREQHEPNAGREDGVRSPGSGSGDGSWELTSETR
jgi:kexin